MSTAPAGHARRRGACATRRGAATIRARPEALAAVADDVAARLAEAVGSVAVVAPDTMHDDLRRVARAGVAAWLA